MFSAGEIFIKSCSQNFKNIKCPHINCKHSRGNNGPISQTIRALKIKNHIFGFENPIIGRNSRKINTKNSVGPYKTIQQKLLFIEYTWYIVEHSQRVSATCCIPVRSFSSSNTCQVPIFQLQNEKKCYFPSRFSKKYWLSGKSFLTKVDHITCL